jgi:hypothetical protein
VIISRLGGCIDKTDLFKKAMRGNFFLCADKAKVVPNRGNQTFAYVISGVKLAGQSEVIDQGMSLGNAVASRRTTWKPSRAREAAA